MLKKGFHGSISIKLLQHISDLEIDPRAVSKILPVSMAFEERLSFCMEG